MGWIGGGSAQPSEVRSGLLLLLDAEVMVMQCVKCNQQMKLQSSGATEEIYVCPNTSCNNRVTKSTGGYQALKIGGTILGIGLALFGIDNFLEGGGGS
jgi:hypothetical protein